jgi:hypothetical protein
MLTKLKEREREKERETNPLNIVVTLSEEKRSEMSNSQLEDLFASLDRLSDPTGADRRFKEPFTITSIAR